MATELALPNAHRDKQLRPEVAVSVSVRTVQVSLNRPSGGSIGLWSLVTVWTRAQAARAFAVPSSSAQGTAPRGFALVLNSIARHCTAALRAISTAR